MFGKIHIVIDGLSTEDGAKAAVGAVKQLSLDLGIPQTLRTINIPESALNNSQKTYSQTFARAAIPEKSPKKTFWNSTR